MARLILLLSLWRLTFSVVSEGYRAEGGTAAGNLAFAVEPQTSVTAQLGGNFALHCASANGRGQLSWFHNDSFIVPDHRISFHSNGSVEIRDVNWSDEGLWWCGVNGANSTTLLSRRTRVTVARLFGCPEPSDIEVRVGGAVRFHCAIGDSTHPVHFTWLHNGESLDNSTDRFVVLSSGILQITRVLLSDSGHYSCMANNTAGNLTCTKGQLRVSTTSFTRQPLRDPVGSVIQGPQHISVDLHATAFFECLVDFSSDLSINSSTITTATTTIQYPSISWNKIGSRVSRLTSRASIIGGNVLMIRKVKISDEGKYACSVGGVEIGSAELLVDFAPTFGTMNDPPVDQVKPRGETVRFTCAVTANPPPEIWWYHNGKRLHEGGRVKLYPGSNRPPQIEQTPIGKEIFIKRALVISTFSPEDQGVYQCFAANSVGETTVAAMLLYDAKEALNPPPPQNLTVQSVERSKFRLTWEPPPLPVASDLNLLTHIVHFFETEGGVENTEGVTECNQEEEMCSYVCCHAVSFKPFTNYTFYMTAIYTAKGKGSIFTPPSEIVVQRTADALALAGPPLTVITLSSNGAVKLQWGEVSREFLPGIIRDYRIEYRAANSSSVPLVNVVPPFLREYRLKGLIPGLVYLFRIIPITGAGVPESLDDKHFPWVSHTIAVESKNKLISLVLEDVRVINSTAVRVGWQFSSDTSRLHKIQVFYAENNGGAKHFVDVMPSETSLILNNLEADRVYDLTVAAFFTDNEKAFEGSRSFIMAKNQIAATTIIPGSNGGDFPILVEPPMSLNCSVIEARFIRLSWNKPLSNRDIVKYKIRWTQLPSDRQSALNASAVQYVDVDQTYFNGTDLEPGETYQFAVKSLDKVGFDGPYTNDVECRTLDEPPSTPIDLTVRELQEKPGSIKISWEPPIKSNGEIIHYHVYHMKTFLMKKFNIANFSHIVVPGNETSVEIAGLDPTASYTILIAAENSAGVGVLSDKTYFMPWTDMTTVAVEMPFPTVVVPSYKEGIIMGLCLAVFCVAMSALVLMCRRKLLRLLPLIGSRFSDQSEQNTQPKPNGHIPNGSVIVETQELQTLLPQLFETRLDAKGGNLNGAIPRMDYLVNGGPVANGACGQPLLNDNGAVMSTSLSPDGTETLSVPLAVMITGHTGGHQQLMDIYHLGEDRIEQSSDFCSHSPANSSVDTNPSWGSVEEITTTDASVSHNGDIRRNVVGLRGRNGVGSISQSSPPFRVSPHNYHHNHLTDSGIGFDDSTRNGNGQFSRGFVKNSSHRHSVHGSVVPLSTPEAVDENTNFIAVGGDAIPANVAQQQQLLQGSISGTLGSFPVSTNKREKRGRPTGLRTTSECTC